MKTVHASNMNKLITAAHGLREEVPAKQISRIREKILPAIKKRIEAARGPVRKLYETAHNSFSSIADGIKSDDVGAGEFRELIKELSHLQVRANSLAEDQDRVKSKEKASAGLGMNSDLMLENQAKRAKLVLDKYRPFERLVPRSIPKKFVWAKMPVLPLVKPWFQQEKLERFKLFGDSFFGYPILRDQTVLGLNQDWVVAEYKRNTQEAVKDITDIWYSKTGKRYYVVGEPKKRGLVLWVWLATDNTLRKLNSAAVGGHFVMQGWSFPFEADKEVTMPASREALQREAMDKYPSLRT